MLNCLLNFVLFLTAFTAAQKSEVESFKQLALSSNDSVASFFPNKTTIGESELSQLESTLDELDGEKPKQRRDVRNNLGYMDDEFAGATNGQQFSDVKANYEVKTNMKDIEVPVKGGSPAFSIHASKVYILYPSLFQDPNIFGRFTIPQNINLDPVPDKQITKAADFSNDQPQILQPKTNPTKSVNSNPYNPYKTNNNRRPKRQQADGPSSDRKQNDEENNKKRNVETHLTGTIVVLNQDVNEVNRKDAY